ncbi:hypothetical protein ACFLY7_00795 [Patescibacteria group bacterium]
MLRILNKKIIFLFAIIALCFCVNANAYEIKETGSDIKNDFVLEPAKLEVSLDAGESVDKILKITNRTDKTLIFYIEVEDFVGSKDSRNTVDLLGSNTSPYSLKNYIIPEVREFSLDPKEQIVFTVNITIPIDEVAGGKYGSVLISSASSGEEYGTKAVSRLGALLFVKVNGDIDYVSELERFNINNNKKLFVKNEPIKFELYSRNEGSVYSNAYGLIEIKNLAGVVVGEINVEPYFVMPESLRFREVVWNRDFMLGRYTATAFINRGYDNIIDELTVSFWVIPWDILLVIVFSLFILFLIFRITKFFISRKKNNLS